MKTKKIPFVRIVVEDGEIAHVIKNGKVDVIVEVTKTEGFFGAADMTDREVEVA